MNDWKSDAGYEPLVRSTSEQEQESIKTLQKFQYVQQQYPNNLALRKIAQKRQLESLDLTPEELKQVEDAEEQAQQMETPEGGQEQGQLANQVQGQLQELETLNAA